MAYRFFREGQFVKCRKHFDRSGMRPWIDEFQWEVTNWHYKYWMGPQIQKILQEKSSEALNLQYHLDVITSGGNSSKFSQRSKFFFRSALPMAIPYIRSSNPFCPLSANRTGWEECKNKLIEYPTVKGSHQIGGTNPLPPTFPNFK
ncbi:hypothetical protein IE077_002924 [Cardiosporidium cionae]|uniref:Uncharacterized protein n=1 Tax=Cardiosporidium cionae TaxID=476202 RepID=A0ABQ7J9K8_9APIC|nr:hypothetical protein IE077_002924 [Cardiosporidium cionae]|eukprot:KAF8820682.1 hypothetical protein IE077_002924 [Cardiosporidium cionae]